MRYSEPPVDGFELFCAHVALFRRTPGFAPMSVPKREFGGQPCENNSDVIHQPQIEAQPPII